MNVNLSDEYQRKRNASQIRSSPKSDILKYYTQYFSGDESLKIRDFQSIIFIILLYHITNTTKYF